MVNPDDILRYWLDEVGPDGWYKSSDALDSDIRDRFENLWNSAQEGALALWLTYPGGTLAYIILNDQFSRNMFRDTAKAFASDHTALAASKIAVNRGWDMKIDPPARQFFYMPMMHSECLADQERCVRLMKTRMPEGNANLVHAKAHREVIRRFGRFPTRSAALGRALTKPEAAYVDGGGYRTALDAVSA